MKIRVRRGILVSLVALLLLATGAIWWAGESAARRSIDSLSNRLMAQVRQGVQLRVARDLEPAMTLARLNASLIADGAFDVTTADLDYLLRQFESQAEVTPLDGFYVATADGAFLMVKRTPEGLRRRVVLPAGRRQYWQWTAADGTTRTREEAYDDPAVRFDPTTRGWYRAATAIDDADGAIWTDVYPFASDGVPGITAAAGFNEQVRSPLELVYKSLLQADAVRLPADLRAALEAHAWQPLQKLRDATIEDKLKTAVLDGMDAAEARFGVDDPDLAALAEIGEQFNADLRPLVRGAVGVDVTLRSIAEFLGQIEVSEHGTGFLLDSAGRLVGHRKVDLLLADGELVQAATVGDPVVQAAMAEFGAQGQTLPPQAPVPMAVTVDDAQWRVVLAPLSLGDTFPPFTVGVAVPEVDFLSDIRENQVRSAVIAAVSIGVGILLAMVVTRGIARPILLLEEAMSRVKQMDLDVNTDIETNYIEIEQMVRSFDSMVKGLHSFARYVPRDVVLDLIANGTAAEIGGEERELTIWFSDIVGFTGIAENTAARTLFSQLGEYFDLVTTLLREHNGTLDKFIGDAVMALWNAPRDDANHRINAVLAACDVQAALAGANRKWEAEGKPPLATRIGLSTADVMVGNVGSPHRLNYTALGDGVNLASRLEGTNKHYGTQTLCSDFLVNGLPENLVVTQPVDVIAVKGKVRGVLIHELLGRQGSVSDERLERAAAYAAALDRYRDRDFAGAQAAFEALVQRMPGYRPAEILAARCRTYVDTPPPKTWTGVFEMTEK